VDFDATGELQIGTAALRMNSVTSLEFLNLDDSNVQLRLTEGGLNIESTSSPTRASAGRKASARALSPARAESSPARGKETRAQAGRQTGA